MIPGLQVGFSGEPVDPEVLRAVKARKFQVIRCDAQGADDEATRVIAEGVLAAGLIPLVIIDRPEQASIVPSGTHVELLNEPSLNGWYSRPLEYRELVACTRDFAAPGVTVWAGGAANLRHEDLDWLARTQPQTWPYDVGVAVHRYPAENWPSDDQTTPHSGFISRDAEVSRLTQIIGNRSWGVSEFGYHTAPRRLWGWFPWYTFSWSDEQVAEYVRWEFEFWREQGATAAVLYQINDGPTNIAINRFGIRRTDGTWKPVSGVLLGE